MLIKMFKNKINKCFIFSGALKRMSQSMRKLTPVSLLMAVTSSWSTVSLAAGDPVPASAENPTHSNALFFDALKGNYDNLTLEEVQKLSQKKESLVGQLQKQVEEKESRDQQKRDEISKIREKDQEIKTLIQRLKKPYQSS